LEHILFYVRLGEPWLFSPEAKRQLSACGQVCRYWARLCRVQLFWLVILRSADDLHEFCAMLDAPTALKSVAHNVHNLRAALSSIGSPWLHLIPLRIFPRTRLTSFEVDVSQLRDSNSRQSFRNLHSPLPRTLPSFYSAVHSLCFTSVHFSNANQFCNLISGIRSLKYLALGDVSWDTHPTSETFASLSFSDALIYIQMEASEKLFPPWVLAPLVGRQPALSLCKPGVNRSVLHNRDYQVLMQLFSLFAPGEPYTIRDPSLRATWDFSSQSREEDGTSQHFRLYTIMFKPIPFFQALSKYSFVVLTQILCLSESLVSTEEYRSLCQSFD
jgi:hypothetical protein